MHLFISTLKNIFCCLWERVSEWWCDALFVSVFFKHIFYYIQLKAQPCPAIEVWNCVNIMATRRAIFVLESLSLSISRSLRLCTHSLCENAIEVDGNRALFSHWDGFTRLAVWLNAHIYTLASLTFNFLVDWGFFIEKVIFFARCISRLFFLVCFWQILKINYKLFF